MEENLLKTSTKQRIFTIIIAIIMLGSTIAMYAVIILGGKKSAANQTTISGLEQEYTTKANEVNEAALEYSDRYLTTLTQYQSEVKGFNANTANSGSIVKRDLEIGTGRELTASDTDYFAYYIGFCPNEKVFDSSFQDYDHPTVLKTPLNPAMNLIDGWRQGVTGMKLGGVREITIPSEFAYKDSTTPCGEANSPLKFIILAFEKTGELAKLSDELMDIYNQLMAIYYTDMGASPVHDDTGDIEAQD